MEDIRELIRQAQRGDVEAYTQIVLRFRQMAVAYAYTRLGDIHLAEDVVQEAFLQAFFDLPRLRLPLAFAGWLRRIVHKYCDRITRRKQQLTVPLDQAGELVAIQGEPALLVERREVQVELQAAIDELPDRERESFVLCYLGGYGQTEIAAFLEVPVTTVRKRLQAARQRLRQRLAVPEPYVAPPSATADAVHYAAHMGEAIAAVKAGDLARLNSLLDASPALVHARSPDGRSLLGHLTDYPANIASGPALVHALVRAGAAADALALTAEMGEPPLQWAVSANDVAVAEALLDAGASVDGRDGDGRPLAQALFYGQMAAAELLVRRGGRITLEFAAGLGHVAYIARCFDVNGRLTPEAGRHHPPVNLFVPPTTLVPHAELLEQALVYAAINGQVAAIQDLLGRGAQIDALPSGFDVRLTPLHWAVVREQPAAVEALVAHGADLRVRDPQYHATALGWAVYHRLDAVADLLRRYGADA